MIDLHSGRIEILDSTLREGAQSKGVAYSVEDKLSIMRALDDFGITYIEAGNPASNPKDEEFFRRAANEKLTNSRLCAFGSTRKKDIAVAEDIGVRAVLDAGTPVVVIFGKTWDMQVIKVLGASLDENLEMIGDTVSFLKKHGREVIFDAEHFFDGYAANNDYAMQAIRAAMASGADRICLCDTNGGRLVHEISAITKQVCLNLSVPIGIHCHNDSGLADAASIAAVMSGAVHVQGTFIGFGERCGNANLSTVIANLQLKCNYECVSAKNLQKLGKTSRFIADRANMHLTPSMPYVGSSAFAHKGGMHIDAVSKVPASFEHIDPELVGNSRKLLTSEMSGRATVLRKINIIDPTVDKNSSITKEIIERLKQLEYEGYQYEAAESSFELVIRKMLGVYKPYFELEHYRILGEQPYVDEGNCASALVKVRVGDESEVTAAEGYGPVHALDVALRKALTVFYPALQHVRLVDYKVRVMEPKDGTATKVRVLIESTDGENIWSTVGVSKDIIEASWLALSDSIEYKLTLDQAEIPTSNKDGT